MRPTKYLLLILSILILSCEAPKREAEQTAEATSGKEFYELKVYTFANDDQVAVTDDFLGNAFIPAMRRQGISPIGVFKNRINEEDTIQKIYVLIPFKTMDQFLSYEGKLIADETFLDAGKSYIDAPHDNPPFARIASSILEAFDDMPAMATPDLEGPRSERVYELRSYLGPTEKLHLNKVAMFNDGEVEIFDRLGFNAVFYARALVSDELPNLVYMITFPDMKSRDEHWDAFRTDPQWLELKAVEKYQNNMLKSKAYMLYPTDYSAY